MKIKILISLILFNSALHAANLQYSITPLGTLGGSQSSATDINENGEIVGSSLTSQNISHAFYSSVVNGERVMTDLGSQQNNNRSFAKAINNNGQIVGSFQVPGEVPSGLPNGTTYLTHAFISEKVGNNTWVTIDLNKEGAVSSSAEDINDSTQITGYHFVPLSNGSIRSGPFVADKTDNDWSITDLYPVVTGRESGSVGINNSGQLAVRRLLNRPTRLQGLSVVNDNGIWQVSNLGTLGGANLGVSGINDSNHISGFSQAIDAEGNNTLSHAVIAIETDNGWTLTDLGQINGQSTISQDINDLDVVIGYTSANNIKSAFIYIDNQMHTLMDLVTSGQEGWTSLQQATSVNNFNQIVGVGQYNGETMAYLLTPITENTSTAICEMGLDPQTIKQGEGTALWWWSDKVTSGSINNGIGSLSSVSDYKWIYPTETTTYTMTANGTDGNTTTCEATIIVEGQTEQSPAVCEMGADPKIIRPGQGTALWWWSDNVTSASINNGIGTVTTPSDYTWFYPTQTATYTMNAVSAGGVTTSCETTIEVTNRH